VTVAPGGTVYVADFSNSRIQAFDGSGAFLGAWGSEGRGEGQLSGPISVAAAPDAQTIYVADIGNQRIQAFCVAPPAAREQSGATPVASAPDLSVTGATPVLPRTTPVSRTLSDAATPSTTDGTRQTDTLPAARCATSWRDDAASATRTLLGDCTTDRPIEVPAGWTFDGRGHTIVALDPPGGTLTGGVIEITGPSGNLRNVTIEGAELSAPCAVDDGQTTLAGVVVRDAAGEITGITVRDLVRALPKSVDTPSVAASKSCGDGIAVMGSTARVFIDGNAIENVGSAGILVREGEASIARNTVEHAAIFGMIAFRGAHVRISPENRVRNGYVGIQFEGPGTGGRVAGNTIEGTTVAGIIIRSGAQAAVANNTLTNAGRSGISTERSGSRATIENNTIAYTQAAITVFGGEAEIRGNTVTFGKHGIVVREAGTAILEGNTIERPSAFGVWITDPGTNATILRNTIRRAGAQGINVGHTASAVIEDNTIRDAADEGIIIEFDGVARIRDTTVIDAAGVGISVTDGGQAEISGENLICGESQGIIVSFTGSTAEISGAVISVAGKEIALQAGGQATIVESDVSEEEAAARCASARATP
jgi:nitrous oxidase accessory protein NosD